MNRQIIMYVLVGVAIAIVFFSVSLFVQLYKENPLPVSKIEKVTNAGQTPPPHYAIPANNEFEDSTKAPRPKQHAFGEALEKRRQIAIQVRAEIEASMKAQAVPTAEKKQAETPRASPEPISTKQPSDTEQKKPEHEPYFIHH